MTASDSSSSARNPPDIGQVNLLDDGRFPPLVEAFLRHRDRDLLAPVRFIVPGEEPSGQAAAGTEERKALAMALAVANHGYGHPDAERLSAQLADPGTKVVITGQQPGLFGGPLYSLSKAVAAELWAQRLREQGEPAVALFWMATEDHDFLESSRAAFFGPGGPIRVDLGDDDQPLVPVGLRRLGARIEPVLDRLREELAGERTEEWLDHLSDWYQPEALFGDAFARLMVNLLGERCPLLVDSLLPALKQAQRPWLRRVVDHRRQLTAAFAERDREIVDQGYPLQVRPQPGASPLFLLHHGQRRRIEWQGDNHVRLRGDQELEEEIDWLLQIVDEEPERVSPGVRARSAIQDAVFGTHLQILGPGELSYLPQAAPLYPELGIVAPWVALRPQILVVEERQMIKLAASGLRLDELTDPDLDLDARLARSEDTAFLDNAEEKIEGLLQELRSVAESIDPNLEPPWRKTRDQMQRALQVFAGKVTAAAGRRDETRRGRIEALRSLCLPLGQPQERVISSAYYPGKFGQRFPAAMFEQMRLDPTNLQIVSP